jgi:hypothetical protein
VADRDFIRAEGLTATYSLVFGHPGTCTYCGEVADSLDHVIPWSYLTASRKGAVRDRKGADPGVKTFACRECNNILGARHFQSFYDRLKFVNDRLRKKCARDLTAPKWDEDELAEIGKTLKVYLDHAECRSAIAKSRVGWMHNHDLWLIVEDIRELTADVTNPKYREFLHRYFARQERAVE